MDRKERDKITRETANNFISTILVNAVIIEQYLTGMIAHQFTKKIPDKTHFIEYFDLSTFERKIQLFELILKYKYPDLLTNYKNTILQIKQIKDIRNKIAHNSRSFHDNGQEIVHVLSPTVVRLERKPEGGFIEINVEKYSVKKMTGLMKMSESCTIKIREVESKITKTK